MQVHLLDGTYELFRHFFAVPSHRDPGGTEVGAVRGVLGTVLTILEEGILALPDTQHGVTYMRVNPEFRAIFTSNPEDYAGVHKTQNALLDRMITIELDYADRETEVAITRARAGVDQVSAERIVNLVRRVRADGKTARRPTLRASIMIARIMRQLGCTLSMDDPVFFNVCLDVLHPGNTRDADWQSASLSLRGALKAAR